MLSMEEALAATTMLSTVTVLTVYGVSRFDDNFVDANSWAWCVYAGTAVATYLLGMAMAVVKVGEVAYMVVAMGGVSVTALAVWLLQQHEPRATDPQGVSAPLIVIADAASTDTDSDSSSVLDDVNHQNESQTARA